MNAPRETCLRNQVQLITYPDSLGGNIAGLKETLRTHLDGAIGGVHILPFYPSSADRGFAPLTHLSVDPKFGTWDDINDIADTYDLVADLTVNHMSCMSPYFQDFLEKGHDSKYAKMFLDVDAYLEHHGATIDSLATTYRPHPTLPFTEFRFKDGVTRKLWTTFTNHQVDLDLTQPVTRDLMVRFIKRLAEHGVRLIRLDAVGYTMKKPWTNSFLIPETYEFMRWIQSVTPPHVELLAEIHHSAEKQRSMLESNVSDWIYDFSLPMLALHTLFTKKVACLKEWITTRPTEQITVLDTHDGIGVIDVEGLMTAAEIAHTVAEVERRGGKAAYRASGIQAKNVDIYQVNTTYYSALGEDDDAYIVARALQFFIPGIPQVYYVGLLAGSNDFAFFEKTKHGRDVNRHNYTHEEIALNMGRSVVQRLLRLMYLRSTHPAFNGGFTLKPSGDQSLVLRWDLDGLYCEARVDVSVNTVEIEQIHPKTGAVEVRKY